MGRSVWDDVAGEPKKPKLTREMIKGRRIVLTIARARVQRFGSGDEMEKKLFVSFEEFPEHELNCNKGEAAAFQMLVSAGKLDKEYDEGSKTFPGWRGVRVPLEVYETNFKNETFEKLRPMHPEDYDDALEQYDLAAKKAKK